MPVHPDRHFVTPDWLLRHIDDPDVVVVDGSWHMPAAGRSGRTEYLAGHIPGAVNVPWGQAVREAFAAELAELTRPIADTRERNKAVKAFIDGLQLAVVWTHRHYIADDEYIPFDPQGEPADYIPAFLAREIAKPIIRWQDSPQLGYEILPNKYFYRYQPPKPASELLAEFWALEKEAEGMLEKLA